MKEPVITEKREENNRLRFHISDINVSLVNGLRRTILTDIPVFVFKTTPHEENQADIIVNKTRFNNEIIKQRLSCVPIHIDDLTIPYENLEVEIHKKNDGTDIIFVTTEDFKIKDIQTEKYLEQEQVKKIFPPFITPDKTEHYIDFIRLRPKLGEAISGEEIKINAKISIGDAKEHGMYNVVSTCTYSNHFDEETANSAWEDIKREKQQENSNIDSVELERLKQNWMLLEGKRYYVKDTFDFMIETVGIYKNNKLIKKACQIIKYQLEKIGAGENITITKSDDTMDNSHHIILKNKDYTIGKILEYGLYNKYYEDVAQGNEVISYVSFFKKHPHDDDGILKVSFTEEKTTEVINGYLSEVCKDMIETFDYIDSQF
tara:strand:- start:29 stop:1153 length:1125 start_codon:yes stop_codon:yes gene_type:complete